LAILGGIEQQHVRLRRKNSYLEKNPIQGKTVVEEGEGGKNTKIDGSYSFLIFTTIRTERVRASGKLEKNVDSWAPRTFLSMSSGPKYGELRKRKGRYFRGIPTTTTYLRVKKVRAMKQNKRRRG
jgi:hypothetical protein